MYVVVPGVRRMAPCAVNRNPYYLGPVLLELRQHFVVKGHLVAADRTPIGGIKRQDDRPALHFV